MGFNSYTVLASLLLLLMTSSTRLADYLPDASTGVAGRPPGRGAGQNLRKERGKEI